MSRVDWSKWRTKAAAFFMAWWDRRDPSKDIRYLAFCVYVVAAVAWLSREQHTHGITQQWVEAFKWFAASVSLGSAAWMFAESRGGGSGTATRTGKDEGPENTQGGGS